MSVLIHEIKLKFIGLRKCKNKDIKENKLTFSKDKMYFYDEIAFCFLKFDS